MYGKYTAWFCDISCCCHCCLIFFGSGCCPRNLPQEPHRCWPWCMWSWTYLLQEQAGCSKTRTSSRPASLFWLDHLPTSSLAMRGKRFVWIDRSFFLAKVSGIRSMWPDGKGTPDQTRLAYTGLFLMYLCHVVNVLQHDTGLQWRFNEDHTVQFSSFFYFDAMQRAVWLIINALRPAGPTSLHIIYLHLLENTVRL